MLGRFGWKAGEPTLNQQSSHAMAGDVGVGNPIAPPAWGDCTAAQAACRAAPSGNSGQYDGLEASQAVMDQILFYARNLAVPARRNVDDPTVLRGKRLFYQSGCIACHVPKLAIRRDWGVPALAGQLIWPYTDLLLHDMGPALADHRPEGMADGRSGGPHLCGGSALPRPSTAILTFCITGGRAT
jgi:CxxC motif-containing protein (DUF1111 family)